MKKYWLITYFIVCGLFVSGAFGLAPESEWPAIVVNKERQVSYQTGADVSQPSLSSFEEDVKGVEEILARLKAGRAKRPVAHENLMEKAREDQAVLSISMFEVSLDELIAYALPPHSNSLRDRAKLSLKTLINMKNLLDLGLGENIVTEAQKKILLDLASSTWQEFFQYKIDNTNDNGKIDDLIQLAGELNLKLNLSRLPSASSFDLLNSSSSSSGTGGSTDSSPDGKLSSQRGSDSLSPPILSGISVCNMMITSRIGQEAKLFFTQDEPLLTLRHDDNRWQLEQTEHSETKLLAKELPVLASWLSDLGLISKKEAHDLWLREEGSLARYDLKGRAFVFDPRMLNEKYALELRILIYIKEFLRSLDRWSNEEVMSRMFIVFGHWVKSQYSNNIKDQNKAWNRLIASYQQLVKDGVLLSVLPKNIQEDPEFLERLVASGVGEEHANTNLKESYLKLIKGYQNLITVDQLVYDKNSFNRSDQTFSGLKGVLPKELEDLQRAYNAVAQAA